MSELPRIYREILNVVSDERLRKILLSLNELKFVSIIKLARDSGLSISIVRYLLPYLQELGLIAIQGPVKIKAKDERLVLSSLVTTCVDEISILYNKGNIRIRIVPNRNVSPKMQKEIQAGFVDIPVNALTRGNTSQGVEIGRTLLNALAIKILVASYYSKRSAYQLKDLAKPLSYQSFYKMLHYLIQTGLLKAVDSFLTREGQRVNLYKSALVSFKIVLGKKFEFSHSLRKIEVEGSVLKPKARRKDFVPKTISKIPSLSLKSLPITPTAPRIYREALSVITNPRTRSILLSMRELGFTTIERLDRRYYVSVTTLYRLIKYLASLGLIVQSDKAPVGKIKPASLLALCFDEIKVIYEKGVLNVRIILNRNAPDEIRNSISSNFVEVPVNELLTHAQESPHGRIEVENIPVDTYSLRILAATYSSKRTAAELVHSAHIPIASVFRGVNFLEKRGVLKAVERIEVSKVKFASRYQSTLESFEMTLGKKFEFKYQLSEVKSKSE